MSAHVLNVLCITWNLCGGVQHNNSHNIQMSNAYNEEVKII